MKHFRSSDVYGLGSQTVCVESLDGLGSQTGRLTYMGWGHKRVVCVESLEAFQVV